MLLTWRFLPTIASLEYAQIYAFSFLSSSELARHWTFKSQSTGLQALFALNLCFRRFDWHECSAEERALLTWEEKKNVDKFLHLCKCSSQLRERHVISQGSLLFFWDKEMGRLQWNSDCWGFHPCLWTSFVEYFHTACSQDLVKLGPAPLSRNKYGFIAPQGTLYKWDWASGFKSCSFVWESAILGLPLNTVFYTWLWN